MKNISSVVANYNCTGCGSCKSLCPTQCISMPFNEKRGIFLPVIEEAKCISCEKCTQACPGEKVDFKSLKKIYTNSQNNHSLLGNYNSLKLGSSSKTDFKKNGASGGVVTAIIEYLFIQKIINGALVLTKSKSHSILPEPTIINNIDDLYKSQGSWYCPSPTNIQLDYILNTPGKYVVVGLPCHVHSIRKIQQTNKILKERIILVLGIFCANNNTLFGTQFFLKTNKIGEIDNLKYRANGWPGKILVEKNDTKIILNRGTAEPNNYKRALFSEAFHYKFMQPRCLICADQTNELADISFADPHLKEIKAKESIGISWFICRNDMANVIIENAISGGYIIADDFPIEKALNAQNYNFKKTIGERLFVWKVLNRNIPNYNGLTISPNFKINALKYFWSYFYSGSFLLRFTFIITIPVWIKINIIHFLLRKIKNAMLYVKKTA